ncbi:type I DNA topoisomerase [candidate division KSB1 bacterium]|nr:type I DNA topoisomerase [candidate division KSB1 bacterium]
MAQSLVIVESVAKTKTINKFLGKKYNVLSSVGHIKDLPKGKLGVDIEQGFQPDYITIRGKGKILNDLKKAASTSDTVYIATDPDREGEAIAHHIYEEIKYKNSNIYRILFNEITEPAVVEAIKHPLTIDEQKVEAQKARRVLDRLVGYKISPILWNTLYTGLSAGRVQSVALRLIVERELEVEAFVPQEYWTITAQLQGATSDPFLSRLHKIGDKKPEIPNEKDCKSLLSTLKTKTYAVKSIQKKQVTRNPAPPFTTSTMQQEAARRLGMSSKQIMMIAQQLYEGVEIGKDGSVGLISYMRTDSTRIADVALEAVREYIVNSYGLEYLPAKARVFKTSKRAQDAHEAIRPTNMKYSPKEIKEYLSKAQYNLYELIWNRFVACQMSPAKLDQTTIDIIAGVKTGDKVSEEFLFRTTGSVVTFRGFLQAFEDYKEDSADDSDANMAIPTELNVGEILYLLDLIPKQHFTKPPPRYSESSLVKELDNLGIGRPSTYALIISTLLARKYIDRNGRQLTPTELGRTVNNILIHHFPDLFNVEFTALMEEELDQVESGDKKFTDVMGDFYQPFDLAVKNMDSKVDAIKHSLMEDAAEECPKCGSGLIIRWGRNGKFIGCSNYPECKYTKPLDGEQIVSDEVCEKCGKPMVVKVGRYGRFLACSGYPDCNNAKPYPLGVPCPKDDCNGKIIERKSKRGKVFYGCSAYPKCDFVSWYKPVNKECPECHNPYLEERYSQRDGEYLVCPKCKTKFESDTEEVSMANDN